MTTTLFPHWTAETPTLSKGCTGYSILRDAEGQMIGSILTEHAALAAKAPEMLAALEQLFEHCAMIHKHWGENSNIEQADAAINLAASVIGEAKGDQ